jgi:hypothetical protein
MRGTISRRNERFLIFLENVLRDLVYIALAPTWIFGANVKLRGMMFHISRDLLQYFAELSFKFRVISNISGGDVAKVRGSSLKVRGACFKSSRVYVSDFKILRSHVSTVRGSIFKSSREVQKFAGGSKVRGRFKSSREV